MIVQDGTRRTLVGWSEVDIRYLVYRRAAARQEFLLQLIQIIQLKADGVGAGALQSIKQPSNGAVSN